MPNVFEGITPDVDTIYNDGGSTIITGNHFYGTVPFWVTGVRVWNPPESDSTFLNTATTVFAYGRDWLGSQLPLYNSWGVPTLTKTHVATRTANTWTEILFDTPLAINAINAAANSPDVALIGVRFGSAGYYVITTDAVVHISNSVPSTAVDGLNFVESGFPRTAFTVNGTTGAAPSQEFWYGLDLMYSLTEPTQSSNIAVTDGRDTAVISGTASPPAGSYYQVWSGTTPITPGDTSGYTLGTNFDVTATTYIYGARIWNPGLYTKAGRELRLWDRDAANLQIGGMLLPTLMTTGWSNHLFASPIEVTPGNYSITYDLGGGANDDYGFVSGGLSATVTSGPITIEATGGRYNIGAVHTFPTTSSTSFYGLDPLWGAAPSNDSTGVFAVTDIRDTGALSGTSVAPSSTPQNLVATPISATQVDLTWNAVAGVSLYVVERDGVIIADSVATNAFSDTGLAPGTAYSYYVLSRL